MMKRALTAALMMSISWNVLALPKPTRPVPKMTSQKDQELKSLTHKVYTLQEQPMEAVNWVYLGYAPRMQDPNRIRVILSKQGFTMRVNMEMTASEVADYPAYLKRRLTSIDQILFKNRSQAYVNIKQSHYYLDFMDTVERISSQSDASFTYGLNALKSFFPENVRQVKCSFDASQTCVEGNFVYPITIHRDGMIQDQNGNRMTVSMNQATPEAASYNTQYIDERRSAHYEYDKGYRTGNVSDHLFNGLPAFWFKTAAGSKGQGIHGPIRFSSSQDGKGLVQQDYLNDPDYWTGINPLYRFEVVRTANSEGCIRSEPMELRHMLPSDPKVVSQVPIKIINGIDLVDDMYVDVNYYVENHYKGQNKRDWYLKHYISFEERREAKIYGISMDELLDEKLASTKVFPYLHPRTVEFEYMLKGSMGTTYPVEAPEIMTQLNRAPRPAEPAN